MDRYRLRKKRKNLKMYKKKDFDLNKFVDRYYMEKEAAYITVYVESIDDIISFYAIKDYEWIFKNLTTGENYYPIMNVYSPFMTHENINLLSSGFYDVIFKYELYNSSLSLKLSSYTGIPLK